MSEVPPKPKSTNTHPELVRFPEYTFSRRIYRAIARALCRLAVFLWIRYRLTGKENVPQEGPVLIVSNHLGDADVPLGIALLDRPIDTFVKIDLYDLPVAGKLIDAYGVIWVHRGQPDRRALRTALQSLAAGRAIGIAPEGRESLSGALEEGTQGAAYLALKSGAPVLPVTFTGTENRRVFSNIRRFRRTDVTVKVGRPFFIESQGDFRTDLEQGTERIMQTLASQLPPEYRGIYA